MKNNLQENTQLLKKQLLSLYRFWQICQSGGDLLSGEVL